MKKIIILHNIISPYKILLFNALSNYLNGNVEILYFAETAKNREWEIDYNNIHFSYYLLNRGNLDDLADFRLSKQVISYLQEKKEEISVVVAGEYNNLAYWSAWFWAWKQRIPFGSIMESTEYDHKRQWFKEKIKSLFFANCQFIFAAGSLHKEYVEKLGVLSNNIHIIGGVGGVNTDIYECFRKKLIGHTKVDLQKKLHLPKKKYIIYVGRFSPEKNLYKLLEAYAEFKHTSPNWGLLLVGSGPQEQEIREYISRYKISDIILPGFVQQKELPLYYLVSDVFILPSISEPWGLVVDEAMTLGLPVLVSIRCGCVAELVQNGRNGYCFNPINITEISSLIKKIATKDSLRKYMGKQSRMIISQYSSEHSAKIMAKTLERFVK